LDPEAAADHLRQLDEALAAVGRTRAEIRCYVGPGRTRPLAPDLVRAYEDLGFDQVILPLFATSRDDLERRAERLLTATGRGA
jgi:hypothetical protein